MSEKPEKRLVSKGQYVRVMGKRLGFGGVSVLFLALGFICILSSLLCVCGVIFVHNKMEYLLALLAFIAASVPLLTVGFRTKDLVEASQSIAPITDKNAHLLPLHDTLVRGSDLPPTVQQSELLRATQAGQETPQEELMRATTEE